jgi:hypothetical protein
MARSVMFVWTQALLAGAHVPKPVDRSELLAVLASVLPATVGPG